MENNKESKTTDDKRQQLISDLYEQLAEITKLVESYGPEFAGYAIQAILLAHPHEPELSIVLCNLPKDALELEEWIKQRTAALDI